MNFNKRVNGLWTDTPHYIHNTSTDTITTLPADIYVNDTTATVGLKGNMSQSSTPTPQNPIQPSECGERTGNLWNEDYTGISGSIKYVSVYVGNGSFTLSTSCPAIERAAALFFLTGNVQSGASTVSNGVYKNRPITVTSTDGYVTVAYRYVPHATVSADPRNEKTMLNTGSTPLPYEPYGYKIPISSANTTTPVYLGEVESTRRIKKLVLTGEETLTSGSVIGQIRTPLTGAINSLGLCTHYIIKTSYGGAFPYFRIANNALWFELSPDGYETKEEALTDFKAYLAAQYAAGTPVTVWYVLATPETGIVNEPLMRIGDYADEVSGISIPTIAGANTISVGTTLQPSEVTVNYKGWHPVADVHEAENGQWD